MVTYVYWTAVLVVIGLVFFFVSIQAEKMKIGLGVCLAILLIAWGAYYFRFQQVFVKHWGGVMSVTVPKGQQHIATTWKDDNLWIENYSPEKNECYFSEFSKGNVLQGTVTIKNCSPVGLAK